MLVSQFDNLEFMLKLWNLCRLFTVVVQFMIVMLDDFFRFLGWITSYSIQFGLSWWIFENFGMNFWYVDIGLIIDRYHLSLKYSLFSAIRQTLLLSTRFKKLIFKKLSGERERSMRQKTIKEWRESRVS